MTRPRRFIARLCQNTILRLLLKRLNNGQTKPSRCSSSCWANTSTSLTMRISPRRVSRFTCRHAAVFESKTRAAPEASTEWTTARWSWPMTAMHGQYSSRIRFAGTSIRSDCMPILNNTVRSAVMSATGDSCGIASAMWRDVPRQPTASAIGTRQESTPGSEAVSGRVVPRAKASAILRWALLMG